VLFPDTLTISAVLILGFGREGRSTYRLIKQYFPEARPLIADRNSEIDLGGFGEITNDQLFIGDDYLNAVAYADVVFKSPGVKLPTDNNDLHRVKVVSQTLLFLEKYHRQVIGITGTKGKSTTASLIFHLLKTAGKDALLVGNIGVPPFDATGAINHNTIVVFELSAHQLEFVRHSPHIAILLNIFQEHLDHFGSFERYADAKFNIAKHQATSDHLIYDASQIQMANIGEFQSSAAKKIQVDLSSGSYDQQKMLLSIPRADRAVFVGNAQLKGRHNLKNMMAAASACYISGVALEDIEKGLSSFTPLEHRLEFAGEAHGITFINDSISTIPEATIEAVKTFPQTAALILGGHDRKIDYTALIDFLAASSVSTFIFTGAAGRRMMEMLEQKQPVGKRCIFVDDWGEIPEIIKRFTPKGSVCLLSPAASSYDRFKNFEARGNKFKEIVAEMKSLP
jgi:UDP-N-acetylmuramoyl-L-alanine---L-glutamate ligase